MEFATKPTFDGTLRQTTKGDTVVDCPRCRKSLGANAPPVARAVDGSIFFAPPNARTHIWEKSAGVYRSVTPNAPRRGKRGSSPASGSTVRCICGYDVVLPTLL
jgi:hypothetical protein